MSEYLTSDADIVSYYEHLTNTLEGSRQGSQAMRMLAVAAEKMGIPNPLGETKAGDLGTVEFEEQCDFTIEVTRRTLEVFRALAGNSGIIPPGSDATSEKSAAILNKKRPQDKGNGLDFGQFFE